ncbi:hypothetical protein D0U04_26675 [Bacillus clarus]|uniref:Uncharacterized protein n=1 Tax=Bacillus clarus TaxID=2338372 RepID=A0ABX9KNT9_9BACI|nr:hypothetical protein D0U04_26675 [Bacillus clarus]
MRLNVVLHDIFSLLRISVSTNLSNLLVFWSFVFFLHVHQAKVLISPLNEHFLFLQVVTLRSQLIFSF